MNTNTFLLGTHTRSQKAASKRHHVAIIHVIHGNKHEDGDVAKT